MTPEGKVKAAIKAYLKTLPRCWFYMPVQNGMGVTGIPDIVGVVDSVFFGIECKAPGKSATPNQNRVLAAIRAAGGIAVVASDVEVVRVAFASLTEGAMLCSGSSR